MYYTLPCAGTTEANTGCNILYLDTCRCCFVYYLWLCGITEVNTGCDEALAAIGGTGVQCIVPLRIFVVNM